MKITTRKNKHSTSIRFQPGKNVKDQAEIMNWLRAMAGEPELPVCETCKGLRGLDNPLATACCKCPQDQTQKPL